MTVNLDHRGETLGDTGDGPPRDAHVVITGGRWRGRSGRGSRRATAIFRRTSLMSPRRSSSSGPENEGQFLGVRAHEANAPEEAASHSGARAAAALPPLSGARIVLTETEVARGTHTRGSVLRRGFLTSRSTRPRADTTQASLPRRRSNTGRSGRTTIFRVCGNPRSKETDRTSGTVAIRRSIWPAFTRSRLRPSSGARAARTSACTARRAADDLEPRNREERRLPCDRVRSARDGEECDPDRERTTRRCEPPEERHAGVGR